MKTRSSIGRDSMTRSLKATGLFLKKQLWVWPLIAAVFLGMAGFWLRSIVERIMKDQMAVELGTLLNANVETLRILFGSHQAVTTIAASNPDVRRLVGDLVARGDQEKAALLRSPELAELRAILNPWLGQYEYYGFRIIDRRGRIIAAHRDVTIGEPVGREEREALDPVLAGTAAVSLPRPSEVPLADVDGQQRIGVPTMFALAPIRGRDGEIIAALGFRMRPERTMTRVLNVARFGTTGETYAFDRSGRILSRSRFDEELKQLGLLTDQPHVQSSLSLELRDPQVDMTTGARPALRRGEQPLTRIVADAVQGKSGVDVDGYRDYRGAPSVGAWTWLPEFGFGVATEVDRAEAYRPLVILRTAFWGLFALLAVAAVAIFVFTVLMARLQRGMRKAALAAKQLGRYTLEEKLGQGGMGVVYRAHHAMLRRPTAIKLLAPEKTGEAAIARFEREVQLTSQLNHPNTVTIYDYGRTPEGIFYYAMEFLDGINLQDLIEAEGPQPEGRTIHILTQICGSLDEAHGIGLIHRDIKPANLILNRRGGQCDVVKVVDFGLVKATNAGREAALTDSGTGLGTPQYMAPEGITSPDQVDARCDLYGVGAVGYALLTGKPVFEGKSVGEILNKQLNATVEPPSMRLGKPVSADLESLLLRCLAKKPEERPVSAKALALELAQCVSAGTWATSDAEAWWMDHAKSGSPPSQLTPAPPAPTAASNVETVGWVQRPR